VSPAIQHTVDVERLLVVRQQIEAELSPNFGDGLKDQAAA
jgi:hypothetical protein